MLPNVSNLTPHQLKWLALWMQSRLTRRRFVAALAHAEYDWPGVLSGDLNGLGQPHTAALLVSSYTEGGR